jgi:hypothetical protein
MPFSASELAPTLRPLEQAWQPPPRAFTDEAVFRWELEHLFLGGWACAGHVGAPAERLARHRLGTLRRAASVAYDVAANWKAIVQNYSVASGSSRRPRRPRPASTPQTRSASGTP